MRIKRKNMIALYLFTASLLLTGIWRFSAEERLASVEKDSERLSQISFISTNLYFHEKSVETFSSMPVFEDYVLPLDSGNITSYFGFRNDPFSKEASTDFHKGLDIAVENGTKIIAVYNGVVSAAEYDDVGGNYVKIDHGNGFESYYGHMSELNVSVGEKVLAGQVIGLSGASGKVTGPHLHFGLYYKGVPVDPDVYLNFENW